MNSTNHPGSNGASRRGAAPLRITAMSRRMALHLFVLAASAPALAVAQDDVLKPDCQVQILTTINHVEPVPYSFVTVTQGGQSWDLAGGPNGTTPPVALDCLDAFQLAIHEVYGPSGGTTVGQLFLYDNRQFSSTDLDSLLVSASVPECRHLKYQPQSGVKFFHDGVDPAWIGMMEISAKFASDPLIGFLPQGASVDAYLNYHGASLVPSAEHGFILRVDQKVDLPPNGIVLAVDVRKFYQKPSASTHKFGGSFGDTEFKATVLGPNVVPPFQDDDDLFLWLQGTLTAGDNVVLLREGSDSDSGAQRRSGGSSSSLRVAAHMPPSDSAHMHSSERHASGPSGIGVALLDSALAGDSSLTSTNQGSCTPPCPPSCATDCTPPTPPTKCEFTPVAQGTTDTTICQSVSTPACQPNPTGTPQGLTSGAGFVGGINVWVIGNIGGTAYQEFSSTANPCQCTKNFYCKPGKKTTWKVKRKVRAFVDGGSIWESNIDCVETTVDTHCGRDGYMVSNTCPIPNCP